MQREWKDPRDGTVWLVTLSPLGTTFDDATVAPRDHTISFHKAGNRPRWTRYTVDRPLELVTDQEFMDLLDAAPVERSPTHHPNPRRAGRPDPTRPAGPMPALAPVRRAEG